MRTYGGGDRGYSGGYGGRTPQHCDYHLLIRNHTTERCSVLSGQDNDWQVMAGFKSLPHYIASLRRGSPAECMAAWMEKKKNSKNGKDWSWAKRDLEEMVADVCKSRHPNGGPGNWQRQMLGHLAEQVIIPRA